MLSRICFIKRIISGRLCTRLFNGELVTIALPPIAVNGNKVVAADNIVTNGVVHIIDRSSMCGTDSHRVWPSYCTFNFVVASSR
jgi:hypothetical protein